VSDVTSTETQSPTQPAPDRGHQWHLSRRGWTVLLSVAVVVILSVLGGLVRVPYVAVGPGPTYDTLGEIDGSPIVQIVGKETYPTSGQLRMTTVSVEHDITLFSALGLWGSGRWALAPREEFFPPGKTEDDIERENTKMFQDSQSDAEVAALRHLKQPIKVLAQEITKDAPADQLLEPGDRLIVVNGTRIAVQEDVRRALQGTTPGQTISITYRHEEGPEQTGTITLAKASDFGADDRTEGFMGLAPVDRADVPFETKIELQDVGGPSAGLIFALAIVDRLEPGELGGGQTVAGTGAIDVKGNVMPIGGIEFKLVAAREAGATVFLVPKDNCAVAKGDVPDGLRLIKVENLDGAVRALEDLSAGRDVPTC
jgi:PDZ domain-containing protein